MFTFFLLGIAILIGLYLFAQWYVSAAPKTALKTLKWMGIGLFVIIAGFFIASGRLGWAFMGLPVLLPWLMRARAVARAAKAFSKMSQAHAGTPSGDTSDVETRFFFMSLDHDSGDMDGTVREGPYEGQKLTALTTAQLIEILQVCQLEDLDSARVLEAYLDRNRPDWHEFIGNSQGRGPATSTSTMERAEALSVLGLEEGATDKDVKIAHRKLIAGMHPDHGGSDYLAAKINQAKDVLLGD